LRTGLDQRAISVLFSDGRLDTLYVLRVDPGYFRFDVAYAPQDPKSLDRWQAQTGALIVLNGGYYRESDGQALANGLTIVGGQAYGASYGDFAGMLAISAEGPRLRWLRQQPYSADEALLAGLQSFPLLVKPGGELGFPAELEDNQSARRTVIAQDREGRMLLIVTTGGVFTLHQLSAYLTGSDLNLDIALNLDGGPSTGLVISEPKVVFQSLALLPQVIVVFPR
jgi:exopolysaccharide biosynthesis protein